MEQVLAGLPLTACLVYLDNILVPGCTFEEEITNLRTVFSRLGPGISKAMSYLDTDASATSIGAGAVLSQLQNGAEKVIAYYSCQLSNQEHQYCATRRELLAIVRATQHFHHKD